MREILIYLALKYNGNFFKIYEAIQKKEIVPIEELKEVVRKIETQEIKAITIVDDEYPEAFKRCEYSPIVLFYEGNINLLNKEMAIITGEADESNKLEIEKCIKNLLDRNITFISGLQEKLDFHVASNLLSKNKNIVLVSPNGVKKPSFKFNLNENQVNENNYLLLSEKYECNKKSFSEEEAFLWLRLIASLAKEFYYSSSVGLLNIAKNPTNHFENFSQIINKANENINTLIKS